MVLEDLIISRNVPSTFQNFMILLLVKWCQSNLKKIRWPNSAGTAREDRPIMIAIWGITSVNLAQSGSLTGMSRTHQFNHFVCLWWSSCLECWASVFWQKWACSWMCLPNLPMTGAALCTELQQRRVKNFQRITSHVSGYQKIKNTPATFQESRSIPVEMIYWYPIANFAIDISEYLP